MIKRENLKQAIDNISARDPEIGYSLNEMLGMGRIGVSTPPDKNSWGGDFFFLFNQEKVRVKKFIYLNEGAVSIEQRLLIKYGELIRKEELQINAHGFNFRQAAKKIRCVGLKLMVTHEIDYAMARLKEKLKRLLDIEAASSRDLSILSGETPQIPLKSGNEIEHYRWLISFLGKIRRDDPAFGIPQDETDPAVIYQGSLHDNTHAWFARFPFCLDSLMQVGDINLEFFHVRFLLDCLAKRLEKNLFACIVNRKVVGLVFLSHKEELFFKGLEIKYMATLRGSNDDRTESIFPPFPVIKGAGTFLIAGVWMLWKTGPQGIKDISLNSEIGSRGFYESIGFRLRSPYEYVLKDPRGHLLKAILIIADNCPDPGRNVIMEICDLIKKQVRPLRKKVKTKEEQTYRDLSISFLKTCLLSRAHPEFATTAVRILMRYEKKIPESKGLIRFGTEYGLVRVKEEPASKVQPVVVIKDERFTQHLENVFHLENARRIKAIQSMLEHPTLEGKWSEVEPRLATVEELALVHTNDHIERVAQTAGKPLCSFDPDTQTTEKSYKVARLASGAVFSLIDEIWSGNARRGFAFIRPPGHHAEPDRAMGFCLFNNVALGAMYLKENYSVNRVMIVDIDVHHGNGTQAVFYDTDEVLFISMHEFPSYPGTGNLGEVGHGKGEGFTVNIPMAKGRGDRDFAQVVHFLINPIARAYHPGMILVSCGFDLYLHDRLGRMTGTPEGYALLTAMLVQIAESVCNGRIAFVMEGGYSVKGIAECGLRVMQELCGVPTRTGERIEKMTVSGFPRFSELEKVVKIHKKYWSIPM